MVDSYTPVISFNALVWLLGGADVFTFTISLSHCKQGQQQQQQRASLAVVILSACTTQLLCQSQQRRAASCGLLMWGKLEPFILGRRFKLTTSSIKPGDVFVFTLRAAIFFFLLLTVTVTYSRDVSLHSLIAVGGKKLHHDK